MAANQLHVDMRLSNPALSLAEQHELQQFSDWVLSVGEKASKVAEGDDKKDEHAPFGTPDSLGQQEEPIENSPISGLQTPPTVTPESSVAKPKQTKKRAGSDAVMPSAAKQLFKNRD